MIVMLDLSGSISTTPTTAFSRSCVRRESGSTLLFAVNATPVPRHAYRIGAPGEGWYEEILNTDAGIYGGGNIGNWGGMHADPIPWQGRSHSLCLTLPPLSTIGFKWHPYR